MTLYIEERAIKCAQHIIETGDTVRKTAKKFGMSKSTVHLDVTQRLLTIDHDLAERVFTCLQTNKAERHIRGGYATRALYLRLEKDKQQQITVPLQED